MRHYQNYENGYKSATRHMSNGDSAAARLGGLVIKMAIVKLVILAILTMVGIDVYPLVMSLVNWFIGS